MAITFDVVDRFQENKVFQTAQVMNNILRSSKNGTLVIMETKLEVQKKYLFGFNHSNYVVKTEFSKKEQ